jgi:hypothetical protein
MDVRGARLAAEGTGWGAYLDRHLDRPDPRPDADAPGFDDWQRYMLQDCLAFASAVAGRMRLPVGRLTKGRQLAHAFVILPSHDGAPDRWACLDWSGVRTMKGVRRDMQEAWGRLAFVEDVSTTPVGRDVLRDARTRPHVLAALKQQWPRVSASALFRCRLRYLDVIDPSTPTRTGRTRIPDVIDVR